MVVPTPTTYVLHTESMPFGSLMHLRSHHEVSSASNIRLPCSALLDALGDSATKCRGHATTKHSGHPVSHEHGDGRSEIWICDPRRTGSIVAFRGGHRSSTPSGFHCAIHRLRKRNIHRDLHDRAVSYNVPDDCTWNGGNAQGRRTDGQQPQREPSSYVRDHRTIAKLHQQLGSFDWVPTRCVHR